MTRRIPPVRRLLMDAKALIAKPDNWVKGDYALTAKNRWVSPRNPFALKFCPDGALQCAAGGGGLGLQRARRLLRASIGRPRMGITGFADAPETTHPMVMRLFNQAIRAAKEQGI